MYRHDVCPVRFCAFSHMLVCIFILFITLCATGCKTHTDARTEFIFGTVCTVNLFDEGTEKLYTQLFTRLQDIEKRFSINIPDSEISCINSAAGIQPVHVSKEVISVLTTVCEYAAKTDGLFDPSAGALVKLWNIGSGQEHVPSQTEIDAVLPLVDYRKIHINTEDSTVFLEQKGMIIDLGAAAKGYAADELAAILTEQGINRAVIDLGGNIYVFGDKKAGIPWKVGIKNPFNPDSTPALRIETANMSIVTSGVYERFFESDGKQYHHILNTKTGYPVENGIISFSIMAASSFKADILSTSAFVLGIEKGLFLVENEPNAEGICIDSTRTVYLTSSMYSQVTVLDNNFKTKKPE